MSFVLSVENILEHLHQRSLHKGVRANSIEPRLAKNFNLLVTLSNQQFLLVKQEPRQVDGLCKGDLQHEWQLHRLLQNPERTHIRPLLSEMLDFDADRDIAVFRYQPSYSDLSEFYEETTELPAEIAAALGSTLAQIHADTFDSIQFESAWLTSKASQHEAGQEGDWGVLTPDSFADLSAASLKFYQLYQRYDSLGKAVTELLDQIEPCCLTHNDLKFNNVLLSHKWQCKCHESVNQTICTEPIIQLIDWEKWEWGDPAVDLGALVSSYLKLWLESLVVSAGIEIELSLRLAERPLEKLQPSLVALVGTYVEQFPAVIQRFPNFLERVIQFAGLSLIESIQARLHYYEPFGNLEICMLQVAKTLLCEPVAAIQTVFGRLDAVEDWKFRPSLPINKQPPLQPQIAEITPTTTNQRVFLNLLSDRSIIGQLTVIAENLEIHSLDQIVHRGCEPLQLPETLKIYYQQLSPALKCQHLSRQLRNYLYRIYWNGGLIDSKQSEQPMLQNNQHRGIPVDFYSQIHRENSGNGYIDSGWQVVDSHSTGWIVQKQGLKLLVDIDSISPQTCNRGDQVSVRLPENRIDGRDYVAVGNAGMADRNSIDNKPTQAFDALQICLNLTAGGAVKAMRWMTKQLNQVQVPFTLKVKLDPGEYYVWDTVLLELPKSHYPQIQMILQQFYQAERAEFRAAVPFLMKPLAPGLGLAEQPAILPFGMHRFELIATALIQCWQQHLTNTADKVKAIQQMFQQQGLDWQHPYLKAGSSDSYGFCRHCFTDGEPGQSFEV